MDVPLSRIVCLLVIATIACIDTGRIEPRTKPGTPIAAKIFQPQDGDLVFHTSQSSQSRAVRIATDSVYTHMGLILTQKGQPYVLEAVQPVKLTEYSRWVDRGEGKHIIVKRLRDASRILTPIVLKRIRKLARDFLGRPYDLQFRWDDDRLYCSELAYKLLDRGAGIKVGTVQKARELRLSDPAVQRKIQERFGGAKGAFNPDEPIISPQSMFDDSQLVTVYEN